MQSQNCSSQKNPILIILFLADELILSSYPSNWAKCWELSKSSHHSHLEVSASLRQDRYNGRIEKELEDFMVPRI